jgi:hypothetical protein
MLGYKFTLNNIMTVPFLQTSTFTGLVSTANNGTSVDWYTGFYRTSSQSLNTVDNVEFQTIKLSDTTFTGNTAQAISLTGTNLFIELEIGEGNKKYLQLFDVE